jgi:hypothetical protein
MGKVIERARELVEQLEQDEDTDKFLTEFGTWCGKYSRFGYGDRTTFIAEVLNEIKLRNMEVR